MKKVTIDFVTALSTCDMCKKADETVKKILASFGSKVDVHHVDMTRGKERDIEKLRKKYGIIMTPFLAINGKVFTNGKTPREEDLREAIKGALK